MKKKNLDLMNTRELVELFLMEEQKTINSLKKQKSNLVKAINKIKEKIQQGGRVIYIGSGTSGRLGMLDAAECKPTFSTDLFQAIIAGGNSAILQAKEGAEDSTKQALRDLKKFKIINNDVVVGISASGETPYTVSGIRYAKKIKAQTLAVTSNPKSTLSKIAHYRISPETGDEIISGSTRLKSGTAQKIVLNMISSISMIKSGKIYGNLMIDVKLTNKKLVKRAIGIISTICKLPLNKAKALFYKAEKNAKAAIVMHFKNCSVKDAKKLLLKAGFNLRKVIGSPN